MKKIINFAISFILCFASIFPFHNVYAETENWDSTYKFRLNGTTNFNWSGVYQGKTYLFNATGVDGSYDLNASTAETPVYCVRYREYNTESFYAYTIAYYFDQEKSPTDGDIYFRVLYSTDGLNFSHFTNQSIDNTYQYSSGDVTGRAIHYRIWMNSDTSIMTYATKLPFIQLPQNNTSSTILAAISLNKEAPFPWYSTTSDGGTTFPDGTTLSPENTAKYSQVFIVMDVDKNNTVTQEELNYYNSTYNTTYDFSQINSNNDFDQTEFLNYIALLIANGDENPGGGTGTGGSGGSITVSDSFTQTQTQTQSIAENAVNVTVNNDGSINNDNSQFINSVINNNLAGEGAANAFETALGTMSSFVQLGQGFASLASAVLGFLPAWITTLLGLMFSILFVMVIFRLIHLFI